MHNAYNKWLLVTLTLTIIFCHGFTQDTLSTRKEPLHPTRTNTPPVLDGVLDDAAWSGGPLVTGPFITNHPVYGDVLPQKTEVYLSYDNKNIYLAFYCHDDHPEQIKGTITKRDNFLGEDWVGVDLDAMGTRQTTFEHFVNPLGIQGDAINSVSGGESMDPDWVWYSAGKIVQDGYIVEMHIPLKSLKYKSGKRVAMNLAFYRYVSRSGSNASWPRQDKTIGYFNSLATVEFENLDHQLLLEALPVITFSNIREHGATQNWNPALNSWQAGIDLKYGVTSTSTLELTINPDFSQIECDQFQILANQRYPVFYSEKRPFFMEIANQFSLAGANGEGNMTSAVYTRTIVDPAWGAKFSGEFSRLSVGILAAADEWQSVVNPNLNTNALSTIGRLKYLLAGDAYVGILYSGREFGSKYNRVIAADTHFRIAGLHNFSINTMYTFSQATDKPKYSDGAFTLNYNYSQKPLEIFALYEDYGRDFQMDSAFYQRIGIRNAAVFIMPNFYPQWAGLAWIKSLNLSVYGNVLHDKYTNQDDTVMQGKISVNTLWQGQLQIQYSHIREFWAGQHFNQDRIGFFASAQPSNWLNTHVNISSGGAIYYYDPVSPYLGNRFDFHVCLILQLGNKLMQHFSYTYQDFHCASSGSHIYDTNILVSRTTFQFNKYMFLRSLIQFDSFQQKILTDLLASFTLIPGTVLHIGYGSLHEKLAWDNGSWHNDLPGAVYQQTSQSFFCKASYRIQF